MQPYTELVTCNGSSKRLPHVTRYKRVKVCFGSSLPSCSRFDKGDIFGWSCSTESPFLLRHFSALYGYGLTAF